MTDAPLPGEEDTDTLEQTPEQLCTYWLGQVEFADKKRKKFRTRGREIVDRYRNRGRKASSTGIPLASRRMNVLWSNVQTQKPILYAQLPKANVSRRNKTKDPVGRTASIVLQNCLQNSIAMEDFNLVMGQVVEDRLLPGSGLAMVEYAPQIEADQIGWQAAETVYVHWEDWGTNVARTWQEVWFFWHTVYQTRKEVYDTVLRVTNDKAFAEDVRREITLDHHTEDKKKDDGTAKAIIRIIWDKKQRKVLMISPGYPRAPLAVLDPPVKFDGFFPIPRPLNATTSNDTTLPVPDFDQYCDQADEIDLLTQRIGMLVKSLRLRGIYPADMEAIKNLMEAGDQDLIPYDQWQLIEGKGGLEKLVLWFPVETIAATLVQCYNAREQAIQVMYQITGISDIIRGATDAAETATAQQLKAQFGGIRSRESQKDVQRFIRDILAKKAEIIAEHFELPVIQAMSGVQILTQEQKTKMQEAQAYMAQRAQEAQAQGLPPPPPVGPQPTPEMLDALKEPTWEEVMTLLRNDKLRGFVVDVESDSTVEPDQQAQQQAAVAFVSAVTEFVTAWAQVLPMMPQAAPLAGEMLAWATRQWKGADTFEEEIDEFVEQLTKISEQPKGPDPAQQAEQLKAQAEQLKAQTAMGVAQIDQQTAGIKAQAEQSKAQLSIADTLAEHHTTMREKAANLEIAKASPKPNGGAPA